MRRLFQAAIMAAMLTTVLSCGKGEPKFDPANYKDWSKYSVGHFTTYCDPKSVWASQLKELTQGYDRFLIEISAMLEMPVPEQHIDLYVYAPGPQNKEMTGRDLPFFTDSTIHWDGLYPYGYEITKFLLAKKGIEPGKFRVMNEGVPHLLDFSGFNYHDKANRLVNSGKFVGLAELGDNARFDSIAFSARRAESASLCGYIMYNYGLERLFMVWKSSVDWQRSIETIFQLPIDDFEKQWISFARANAIDSAGTMDNDTVKDVRISVQ